jgi:hypothetical protein
MLNAILNGKSASVLDQEGVPAAVADMLRTREDARTSTIFERLSYLPGPVAWSLLRRASGGTLPSYRLAHLETIEFWPNWSMGREDRHHAQPDVFLRWTLGDPGQAFEMIVEAKLPWTGQWEGQWRDQLDAYRNHILGLAPGVYQTAEMGIPNGLIYLCVDGLGRRPAENIAGRKADFKLPADLPPSLSRAARGRPLPRLWAR